MYLPGVGPKRAEILKKEAGISSFEDLLFYFPYKYIDRSRFYKVNEVEGNMPFIQLRGKIVLFDIVGEGSAKRLIGKFTDGTGVIDLVWFKGISYTKERYKLDTEYIVFGKPTAFGSTYNIVHPDIDSLDQADQVAKGLTPYYNTTDRMKKAFLPSRTIQNLQYTLLSSLQWQLPETLSADVLGRIGMLSMAEAIRNVHFPESVHKLRQAQLRLKFDELFFIQLKILRTASLRKRKLKGIPFPTVGEYFHTFYKEHLPFALTNAQKRVVREIRADMGSGRQMNRLLQGDVGSGKTVVAMLALVKTVENGFQGALMAPTEILAHQHYEDFCHLLEPLGVRVALLSGRLSIGKRRGIYEKLAKHEIDIVIGTHALIQDEVQFAALGLAITDEQHRFGINQRALLEQKGDALPDVLVMTATPIPRTLTLTVYGDLDVSMIHQLPPGRKPIRTFVRGEDRRELIYKFVLEEIAKGRQAYVVCPLIESKEESRLSSAQDVYEELSQGIFAGISCGLVHGKLKQKEKEAIMEEFYQGKIKLLVATTVIEVGVNVPNASIMVVEHAQQFGLSQLHQLRGRIGRGEYASYCILVSDGKTENARRRMEIMESTTDGFVLAEEDLKLRGPGQFFGSMQHGLPDLKMADVERDIDILLQARRAALESVDRPEYMSRVLPALRLQYQEQFMNIMEN